MKINIEKEIKKTLKGEQLKYNDALKENDKTEMARFKGRIEILNYLLNKINKGI